MTTHPSATTHPDIQRLMDDWLQAARAADVPAILTHYTPDIVAYDAVQQLEFVGTEAYGKHWQACADMCPGAMIFEIHGLRTYVDGNVGYGHYLLRCGKKDDEGREQTSFMRATTGYQRTDGKWRIAHEHFSAPFDMESGKALFDLRP